MRSLTQLQAKLDTLSHAQYILFSKQMGYVNFEKFDKHIKLLKSINSLTEYFTNTTYDLVYDSKGFLFSLFDTLHLSKENLKYDIEEYEKLDAEIKEIQKSYIYIQTHFKRKSEPIIALAALEHKRRLQLDSNALASKPLLEQLDIIQKQIATHYNQTDNGQIELWGKIDTYILNFKNLVFVFSKDAKLQNFNLIKKPNESLAVILF